MEPKSIKGFIEISYYVWLETPKDLSTIETLDLLPLAIAFEESLIGAILEDFAIVTEYYPRMNEVMRNWWVECCWRYPELTQRLKYQIENDMGTVYCRINSHNMLIIDVMPLELMVPYK